MKRCHDGKKKRVRFASTDEDKENCHNGDRFGVRLATVNLDRRYVNDGFLKEDDGSDDQTAQTASVIDLDLIDNNNRSGQPIRNDHLSDQTMRKSNLDLFDIDNRSGQPMRNSDLKCPLGPNDNNGSAAASTSVHPRNSAKTPAVKLPDDQAKNLRGKHSVKPPTPEHDAARPSNARVTPNMLDHSLRAPFTHVPVKANDVGKSKPGPVPHLWTFNALNSLNNYIRSEKIVSNITADINDIKQANVEAVILSDDRIGMESDDFEHAIRDKLIERTLHRNMNFKMMIYRCGALERKRGKLMTDAFQAKERFKESIAPRTRDHGIEIAKKIIKNLDDAADKKRQLFLKIVHIDNDIHETNLGIWNHFLTDIAEGKIHKLKIDDVPVTSENNTTEDNHNGFTNGLHHTPAPIDTPGPSFHTSTAPDPNRRYASNPNHISPVPNRHAPVLVHQASNVSHNAPVLVHQASNASHNAPIPNRHTYNAGRASNLNNSTHALNRQTSNPNDRGTPGLNRQASNPDYRQASNPNHHTPIPYRQASSPNHRTHVPYRQGFNPNRRVYIPYHQGSRPDRHTPMVNGQGSNPNRHAPMPNDRCNNNGNADDTCG